MLRRLTCPILAVAVTLAPSAGPLARVARAQEGDPLVRGERALAAGRGDGAVVAGLAALRGELSRPDEARARLLLVGGYLLAKRTAKARRHLRRLLKLAPDTPPGAFPKRVRGAFEEYRDILTLDGMADFCVYREGEFELVFDNHRVVEIYGDHDPFQPIVEAQGFVFNRSYSPRYLHYHVHNVNPPENFDERVEQLKWNLQLR